MAKYRRTRRSFVRTPMGALAITATAMVSATPSPAVAAQTAGIKLSGQLLNANGNPATGRVLVFLSPPSESPMDDTPVGMAVVGVDGNYSITVSHQDPGARKIADTNDGWVNFVVVAIFGDGSVQVNNASGRMNANSARRVAAMSGVEPDRVDSEPLTFTSPAMPQSGRLSEASAIGDPSFDISEFHLSRGLVSDVDQGWSGVNPTGAAAPAGSIILSTTDQWTVIGEFHKWKDTTGSFTYGKRADSDIGGSISYDGINWSATAAVKVSNEASSAVTFSFPNNGSDGFGRHIRSSFRYVKEFNEIVGPGGFYNQWTSIRSTQWNTGADAAGGKDKTNEDGRCNTRPNRVTFGPNTTLTRSSLSAYTYSAGATAFGVGLTAKSGYSTYVQAQWKFGSQYTKYWVCGSNAMPTTAHIVYAGPNQ